MAKIDLLSNLVLVVATSFAGLCHAQEAAESKLEDIVVTGSRIARPDYEANSPIMTVPSSALQMSVTPTVTDALNLLPQMNPMGAPSSNDGRTVGAPAINLRGLGSTRSLLLLDGHRVVPTDGFGRVDLDILPPSIIDSVEVITGGASAVYGADAVAGVVNFKTIKNLDGWVTSGSYGITQEGDSGNTNLSTTWGGKFHDGRGRVLVSFAWADLARSDNGDRPYFADKQPTFYGVSPVLVSQGVGTPSLAATQALFKTYGVTNPALLAQLNPGGIFVMNQDGTLAQFTNPIINFRGAGQYLPCFAGKTCLNAVFQGSANAYVAPIQELQAELTRYTNFTHLDYDLTDHVSVYGDLLYSNTKQVGDQPLGAGASRTPVPASNPFVPAAIATWVRSTGLANPMVQTDPVTGLVGPLGFNLSLPVYQFTGGVKGDIPKLDWKWDIYASLGQTSQSLEEDNLISRSRITAILAAPDGGVSTCQGGVNLFQGFALSNACKQYLSTSTLDTTTLKQNIVEGTVQGGILDLPAGKLRFAAGVDYRYNSYSFRPDAQSVAGPDGLFEAIGAIAATPSAGSIDVKEEYAELLVPILRDKPLIKDLSVDLAARYSDYSTSGGAPTYKADGNWKVVNWLSFRGGYQHAIKSPSASDLFSGFVSQIQTIGTFDAGQGDPCDVRGPALNGPNATKVRGLCSATGIPPSEINSHIQAIGNVGGGATGNANLLPEVANTYTVGTVLNPQFDRPLFERLQISVDYWNVAISSAIGTLSALEVLQRCYNIDGVSNPTYSPTNQYCSLVTRDPSGGIMQVTTPTANLAQFSSSGIDAQLDWAFPLDATGLPPGSGGLAVNAVFSYVKKYDIQDTSTSSNYDYAGTIGNQEIEYGAISHPRWKSNITTTYSLRDWTVALRARFIAAMNNATNVATPTANAEGIKAINYFDLQGSWKITDAIDLRATVNNLFNKYPPEWQPAFYNIDRATYDVLGRRFAIGFTARF
jgi:outer membrane receptor protein involved in Fe transport